MVLSIRFCALVVLAVLVVGTGLAAPAWAQKDEMPKSMELARRHYEDERPVENWGRGPVEYLMLDHERNTWKELKTDELRKEFIEWFWGRRDLDVRDQARPFQDEFYRRVAHANERFHGFPRGWRSDRGRVWIILGRPTGGTRRRELSRYGRCSAPEGESWTYRTNNMAFRAQMGEFQVIFVETRIGQLQLCDPSMLGVGAIPPDLQVAFLYTNESAVTDTATEFKPGVGVTSTAVAIPETVAHTEPLTVPVETWGVSGVAGAVLIPFEIPLRSLLFEPVGEDLRAMLRVDASLVGLDEGDELTGSQEWTVNLTADDASRIGGESLRTALLLRAGAGRYSVTLRVLNPLSGTSFVWDGAVEISDSGSAISPLIIGRSLARLSQGGEVGIIDGSEPRLSAGKRFSAVSWLRGKALDAATVRLTLVDSAGVEVELEDLNTSWGAGAPSGPLVVQAIVPEVAAGDYLLRLSVGSGDAPVEARVRVE